MAFLDPGVIITHDGTSGNKKIKVNGVEVIAKKSTSGGIDVTISFNIANAKEIKANEINEDDFQNKKEVHWGYDMASTTPKKVKTLFDNVNNSVSFKTTSTSRKIQYDMDLIATNAKVGAQVPR
jgi:hypothetical protein